MMFIVSIWSFVIFGGQISKIVKDVQKLAIKMLKCILTRPSLCRCVTCICLGENGVRGLKQFKVCINIGNVQV